MGDSGAEARHRAKVYCLNEDGQWDDRGTGHAAVQYMPAEEAAFIVVLSEEDGASHLLQARVLMEDIYQRQQDTIVSWNEPETGVDYALSFQDPDGCTELWEQICSLQGRPADGPPRETETAMGSASHEDMTQRDAQPQLPAPEMRNLQAIAELLVEVPIFRRAKLVEAVLQQDYVLQLVTLFNTVEDLENVPDLHHLFHIFKGLVLLNDTGVYEELLREDLIVSVIGALEYDPELSCHSVNHRAFLKENVKFNQVVPIGDAPTIRKIHQNFHVSFIKDVVLPRALDDHTFAALNQIAFLNNVQIVSHLCNDADYLKRVCEKIGDGEQNAEERHDSLRLLQELCGVVKQLQLFNRSAFYRKFVEHSFFVPLSSCLMQPSPCMRLASIDVLLSTVQHEPSLLRQHVLNQRPECEMMHALLHVLTERDGGGEKPQVAEVLRSLLDPEGMEGREQDDLLNLFYDEFVHKLARPIAGRTEAGTAPVNGDAEAELEVEEEVGGGDSVLSTQQHVCELLSFCVQKHSYRIKYFILRNNVLAKVLRLARSRDKCLVLAALRFFRTCIGLKDEFYNRYIVKNKCFEPVLAQLERNRTRDNLVHSSILELFEFIRRDNIKTLVAHLSDTFVDTLAGLNHVDTFKGILLRNEQNEEFKNAGARSGAGAADGFGKAGRQGFAGRRVFPDDDEDEAYFNDSEEEGDGDGVSGDGADGGADGAAGGSSSLYGDPDAPWAPDRSSPPPPRRAPDDADDGFIGPPVPPSASSLPSHAAGEDKENARGRGDEERGLAAERQPHAEQRAAASSNSLATLGSDYPEDAAPEHEEHAAAPTDDAGAKRQRLSEEVAPAAS